MRKSLISAYEYMKANAGKAITPTALNKHLGVGDYASKHISLLRKRIGCDILVEREGREIKSYTYVSGPEALPVKPAKVKTAKAKAPTAPVKTKATAVPAPAKKNFPKAKSVKTPVVDTKSDPVVLKPFEDNPTSYTVDADFDTMGGIDLRRIND